MLSPADMRLPGRAMRVAMGLLLVLATGAACSFEDPGEGADPSLEGLDIDSVSPSLFLPGSTLTIRGRSFVGQPWGTPTLHLRGELDDGTSRRQFEVVAPARFVEFDELEVDVDDHFLAQLGATDGEILATAQVVIDSALDGKRYVTPQLSVPLSVRKELTPQLDFISDSDLIFVNDWLLLEGSGLLLGGGEGQTWAVVEGCFRPTSGDSCVEIRPARVPVSAVEAHNRSLGRFPFSPDIAGIQPGSFVGSVRLLNEHAAGAERESSSSDVAYEITRPAIFSVQPGVATLGQYMTITGGGFVGGNSGASTLLNLRGQFIPAGERPVDVDVALVPEFVEGRTLQYLVSEADALGQLLELRYASGHFEGEVTPIVGYGYDSIEGDPISFSTEFRPVRQVIHLRFSHNYVLALRNFGLRAVDQEIRNRVVQVVERDFRGINVDIRTDPPSDFALYSEVEIGGTDPNGLGLLGYDNTPGKDVGNLRLHDRIGGVNATTQQDGFPGFGGVFIESLFVFSEHPGQFAPLTSAASPEFDQIFDPFRPDRGKKPVRAADLRGGVPSLVSGESCPSDDRQTQIACAVWSLGNLIGTTISHEVGHSLGLANPQGGDTHYLTDGENRLMDVGVYRSFVERAQLKGQGPGRFCEGAYQYLRVILPTDEPGSGVSRPSCL